MIVVYPVDGGFAWKMIGHDGHDLVLNQEVYTSNLEAARAACQWRAQFWVHATQIDGRMASAF